MPLEKDIATLPKNDREQLKIQLREFKGRPYLDIRIYWTPDAGQTWSPSKKGVTVGLARLADFQDAVTRAAAMVKELEAAGQIKIPAAGGAEPE